MNDRRVTYRRSEKSMRRCRGLRVTRVLERLVEMRGAPKAIVIDNGPEFTGRALDAWAYRRGVVLAFIQPGKPSQNAFAESFNGKFRDECLNQHWFIDIADARRRIEAWRLDYQLGSTSQLSWEQVPGRVCERIQKRSVDRGCELTSNCARNRGQSLSLSSSPSLSRSRLAVVVSKRLLDRSKYRARFLYGGRSDFLHNCCSVFG